MKIDRVEGLVEFSLNGPVTLEVVRDAFEQFEASAHGFVFRGFVWDLRGADVSSVDFKGIIEILQKNPVSGLDRKNMRSAVVVENRANSGLGELWIKVGETIDSAERKVFADLQKARDWVSRSKRNLPAFPIELDRERGIVEFRLAGTVSANEIIEAGNLFFASPPGGFCLKGFVWDLRDADLSTYDHQAMTRVFEANPQAIRTGTLRIATVASKIVDRQLLYLWGQIAETYDQNERRIFVSITAARDWVAENRKGVDPIDGDEELVTS